MDRSTAYKMADQTVEDLRRLLGEIIEDGEKIDISKYDFHSDSADHIAKGIVDDVGFYPGDEEYGKIHKLLQLLLSYVKQTEGYDDYDDMELEEAKKIVAKAGYRIKEQVNLSQKDKALRTKKIKQDILEYAVDIEHGLLSEFDNNYSFAFKVIENALRLAADDFAEARKTL
jgi:hypothetical protein